MEWISLHMTDFWIYIAVMQAEMTVVDNTFVIQLYVNLKYVECYWVLCKEVKHFNRMFLPVSVINVFQLQCDFMRILMLFLWLCQLCHLSDHFLFLSSVKRLVCHPQCPPKCLQAVRAVTPPAAPRARAAAPPSPSHSASIRWLPATCKSPPTSCSPPRCGSRPSSWPVSREVG